MNTNRREELAMRALNGDLNAVERAELQKFADEDPAFARECDALRALDADFSEAGRRLRELPAFTLERTAREKIRCAAAARTSWFSFSKFWFGAGLATACALAVLLVTASRNHGRLERGQTLVAQSAAKNPSVTRVGVMNVETPTAKACLWIPEAEWNALSLSDREALVVYLKSQIPSIRRDPERYAGVPATASNFAVIRNNIANLRDEAFMIVTMVPSGTGWVRERVAAESG